jgi:hypothetical protein
MAMCAEAEAINETKRMMAVANFMTKRRKGKKGLEVRRLRLRVEDGGWGEESLLS